MFSTSKSIPDTSSYLRKKQPLIADQPPPQAGQATAQEVTGPQQQPRQPQPPRLSPPLPSSETTSLQRPASAPQIAPSAQQNDASQGPPPSHGDVQPFQRHTASDEQQNLPRLAGSRIPQTTIHYRLPDAPAPQSSTARSPEVRQDAVRSQISSPGSTTPATVQPPLRPPQTAQATYLRRLTELGQPLGALPRFLQPQPGPLSAATRPPYATPTAAQARDQSTPQQPSSTAVGSPHLDAGSPRPPGMPPVAAPPSLPDPVQEQQKLERQAAISKNLTLQQQREKQRQDRLRGQGAGQAQQLAQQEAQLQPAQQRLEAARQTHAAFAGAPVRYENRGGSLVRIQSDASGVQKTLPVDPANPQEMAQAANWTRQHASAKAELAAAEAAHAPLAAGVQGLKDQHQKLAKQLIEEHRWARSMQQRMQHGASGEAGPPPPFTPATADRHLLARLQAAGDPMAAAVKEEMTPPAVRQFQGRLDTAAPATPMSLLDVVTGGTPGSGARATPAEATAARDLTMKSMGVMDPKNVQLTPLPDGTQALHRPRSGSSAPLAIYDPKQKSLTVQAQNGVLSEEARRMVRNIAGAPGSALESSMPVYFGHGPHATEAEFSSLVEAGKQAHEAARTPEERAAALDKLGLSPAGVKKQLEAGTLSFQQGRLLNGAFNGVMEHDSTLPGTQAALDEWVSRPKNQHMAQWLHEGTPEQRAYVASQFFKQTRQRAEGSLLATPERMEEVRRGHLGGLHPDWGKPGAIAPGSAPDDGPAGLERIPLQGGGTAHMPSGTWTAHDYETLDQHPDIRKLPHAEREAAVDTLLSQYHEQLTSQPGFNAADQQKFHQTAQALRDRVAALKTWGDTAGEGADLVKDAAKSEVGTHVAAGADLSIFDPYGNLRVPGKNLKEQSVYEAQKVKDTTQRLAQPAAEKKIDAALEAIHQDIRNGSFPLAPGEAQDKWIDELSAKLNPQRQQWFDAVQGPADPNTPEGKKHLAHLQQQSLASPENRALIQEYIRTGNKERWKELEHNLKKTPQRAQTEEDQQNSLKNDPLVRGLSNAAGTDLGEYMQGAPGTVAGYFVPGMGSLGKGSRMGRLARRAAGIAAGIGGTVAQNTIENPDSDFEDHKRAVIADYATSLGMKPLQKGAGWAGQTIKDHLPSRPGAGQPHSPDSAPPPSDGQTYEERLALENGSMPLPPMDTAQPQPGDATGQPPPSSQQPIPDTTTPTTPGSDTAQQPQTTANNSQPSQTPSPARESDLPKFGAAQNTIEKLKAQQSPLSPDQQKELAAAEHTVASTIEYNLLRKQAVIEQRGRTLHPTEAAALKNAQATLARLAPAGTNAPPANGTEAGTTAPGAPQAPNSASGPRLQFSQGSSEKKNAGQVMQGIAGDEGRFRRGKASQSADFRDIAKEYALPEELSNVVEHPPIGNEPTKKVYRMDLKAGGHAFLLHGTNGKVWVDTSKMRTSNGQPLQGGDLVYQAAMTYAHNNGLKFVEDPRGVKPIARFRRISQMLSNALRHGTTEHLSPYRSPDENSNHASIPGWRQQQGRQDTAAYENNINQLASAETQRVSDIMRERAASAKIRRDIATKAGKPLPEPGPLDNVQLDDLKWNPEDDSVTHVPTGRRLSERDFKQIVSGLDPARSGVGETTLSRALIARQALLGNVPGGYRVPNHSSEEPSRQGRGEVDVHGDKPLLLLERNKQLFYSQPGASENSGLDESSRGGGSGRKLSSHFGTDPRQLAGQTAQTVNTLNQRVPGLLHDKTHVFHSVEDLLNSDYAKQHPFSKEDLAGLQNAEGFHDPKTGHSAIIAGNVELRHGETPHDALTRVILHERVGHDGLQTLLGSKDSKAQKHWKGLTQRIKPEELNAIASQEGYQHLKDNPTALAHEWFARQAEKSPHLLKEPGLLRDMWETFKAQLRKVSNYWKDTDESHLDTHLHELLRLSRKAALKRPSAANANGAMGANAASPQAYPEGQLHTRQFSLASYAALRQREDKPSSWQEVKPGHRWMSAKQYLPRTGDNVPGFPILKRGSFPEKVNAVADWLKTAGPVTDPWGMKVNFDHPQKQGTQPNDIKNRAAHLLGENLNKDVEDRTERADKIAWFGAVRKTIQDAQARAVSKTGEVMYFRSYQGGIHMVVVDDGEVKDQANIITQYAPQSFDNKNKRYQDTRIEFARDATGTNPPR